MHGLGISGGSWYDNEVDADTIDHCEDQVKETAQLGGSGRELHNHDALLASDGLL